MNAQNMTNQSGYNHQFSSKSMRNMTQNTLYSRSNQNYPINDKVISSGTTLDNTC